ncbi:unnamed protein product [Amoebophrya sp. A25]|nr:unnamed protein product [Amoebophrya sp. A25]|eukprot:GSA25T00025700001.1
MTETPSTTNSGTRHDNISRRLLLRRHGLGKQAVVLEPDGNTDASGTSMLASTQPGVDVDERSVGHAGESIIDEGPPRRLSFRKEFDGSATSEFLEDATSTPSAILLEQSSDSREESNRGHASTAEEEPTSTVEEKRIKVDAVVAVDAESSAQLDTFETAVTKAIDDGQFEQALAIEVHDSLNASFVPHTLKNGEIHRRKSGNNSNNSTKKIYPPNIVSGKNSNNSTTNNSSPSASPSNNAPSSRKSGISSTSIAKKEQDKEAEKSEENAAGSVKSTTSEKAGADQDESMLLPAITIVAFCILSAAAVYYGLLSQAGSGTQ